MSFTDEFESFDGHIWLNTASEGPLPKVSAESVREAVEWKSKPYLLDHDKFARVPRGLKESIGTLLNVPYRDVILANSASYGVHILANGYPFKEGDEVLLMKNDFPTDILPWLALEEKGVKVVQAAGSGLVITPEELEPFVTSRTKFLCLSQVHTFTGIELDIEGFSDLCQRHGIHFVLNLSQTAGNRTIDLSQWSVDAVIGAGYKWLLGPYGTGFAWIRPELRDKLRLNYNYWITTMSESELKSEDEIEYRSINSARKFDVFGTANFFNFVPFKTSIDFLQGIGMDRISTHNRALIDHLLERLKDSKYDVINNDPEQNCSNLIVFSHTDRNENSRLFNQLSERKIHLALWKNRLRVSPHLHNTSQDIDTLVNALNEFF